MFRNPEAVLSAMVFALLLVFACNVPAHAHELPNGKPHKNHPGEHGTPTPGPGPKNVKNVTKTKNKNVATSNANAAASSSSNSGATSDSHDVYKGDHFESAASAVALSFPECGRANNAQGMSFGATIATQEKFCQLMQLAVFYRNIGQPYTAMTTAREAHSLLNGGTPDPREAPATLRASRWFRYNVIQPLFGWLPFIGEQI